MKTIYFSELDQLPEAFLLKKNIGNQFLKHHIYTIKDAFFSIKNMPYGRNKKRDQYLDVFINQQGTCTTKHSLLVALAIETNIKMTLFSGIYYLTAKNTPEITSILTHYKLKEIPEAHCFIQYNDLYFDITTKNAAACLDIVDIVQLDINAIYPKKDLFHKQFIEKWVQDQHINYRPEDIWTIREECISALSTVYL